MNSFQEQQLTRVKHASKKVTQKRLKWDEKRGTHSEKSARSDSRTHKKRAAKPAEERCVKEEHDNCGAEQGRRNKHVNMESYGCLPQNQVI